MSETSGINEAVRFFLLVIGFTSFNTMESKSEIHFPSNKTSNSAPPRSDGTLHQVKLFFYAFNEKID